MTEVSAPPSGAARNRRILLWLVILMTIVGVAARFTAWEKVESSYPDETYDLKFTKFHAKHPLTSYAGFVEVFTKYQESTKVGLPPPTRLLYPYASSLLDKASSPSIAQSLTAVSAAATALMLILAAVWSWRMFSPAISASVSALLAVSLNQLHLLQRIINRAVEELS